MIIHYLTIAFRNMWKYKTQSLTGIFGLAFGLCFFVPALYWLRYESSYDSFYPDASHIYRVYSVEKQSGKTSELVPGIVARKLHEQFPAVEAATAFMSETNTCSAEGTPYIRLRTLNTDSTFFQVFEQVFVSGDARQPMPVMFNIVLTETVAIRLFGDVENAIGQQIQSTYYFFNPPYTVTAVVKDPPPNTNLPFDAILFHDMMAHIARAPEEYQWLEFNAQVYAKLHPRTDVDEFAVQLHDYTTRSNVNAGIELHKQPVRDVRHRLGANLMFSLNFIRLFVAAGILLLFSALFNFLNLYLGLFRQRFHELRQRVVHGAKSGQLIRQMMFELTFSIFLALFLAICFVIIARPACSGLFAMSIALSPLLHLFVVCAIGVMILMMLIGIIPFWRLSFIAMRRLSERKTYGQPLFRRMAVTIQLAVSVVFIFAALVIMMQMRFVNRKDLGFDRSGIIQLSGLLPYMESSIRTALIQELEAIPQIVNVTTTNFEPLHNATSGEMITAVKWQGKAPFEKPAFNVIPTDNRFAETFRLNMQAGDWFDDVGTHKIVLNEEAVRVMALTDPVGATIRMSIQNVENIDNIADIDIDSIMQEYTVVGVVKDFHTLSLRSRIHPTIFRQSLSMTSKRIVTDNTLYIRVLRGQEREAIRRINAVLPAIDPMMAGVSLTLLDELYDRLNRSEQAGLKLFSVLATVCLLISLFGIYAVAVTATRRRRKEIAIRKVVGAEIGDITRMFFREHALQVIIAAVIALPLAYYAMHRWLQGYAYRINIPWWLLTGVIAAVAFVVLLTVLGQVLKAAKSNPADVIKLV